MPEPEPEPELNDPGLGIFPGVEKAPEDTARWGECGCWTCVAEVLEKRDGSALFMPFIVCPECGNKRCPKAMHHEHACSGSNDPGQPGSRFAHVPWPPNSTPEGT